jgi:hypothetical protein
MQVAILHPRNRLREVSERHHLPSFPPYHGLLERLEHRLPISLGSNPHMNRFFATKNLRCYWTRHVLTKVMRKLSGLHASKTYLIVSKRKLKNRCRVPFPDDHILNSGNFLQGRPDSALKCRKIVLIQGMDVQGHGSVVTPFS